MNLISAASPFLAAMSFALLFTKAPSKRVRNNVGHAVTDESEMDKSGGDCQTKVSIVQKCVDECFAEPLVIQSCKDDNSALENEVRSRHSRIQALQKQLEVFRSMQRDLDADTKTKQRVQIEKNGNIKLDTTSGTVTMSKIIGFEPRSERLDRSNQASYVQWQPVPAKNFAAFAQKPYQKFYGDAEAICTDLAKLSTVYACKVEIVGHTNGTPNGSVFQKVLSQARAEKVKDSMVEHGADAALLEARGVPGGGYNVEVTVKDCVL